MAVLTRADVDGVAVLTFDVPEGVNVVDDRTFPELGALLAAVEADDAVFGAVLISGKPDLFCVGADLRRMPDLMSQADPEPVLAAMHDVVLASGRTRKPVVGAVHGPAMGGGLELVLPLTYRLASDSDRTSLGLPEVKLGLLPGGGGTQYLPRLMPVAVALEHLLTGKPLRAAKALALGLVDEVVPTNQLRRLAIARVRELAGGSRAVPVRGAGLPTGAALDELLAGARAMIAGPSRLWPAPGLILDAVEAGLRDGLEAGLAAERRSFAAVLRSPQAAAGVHLFLASEAAKKVASGAGAAEVERVFVLGGGLMGSGIGAQAVLSGLSARVRDLSEDARVGVHRYAEAAFAARHGRRPDAAILRRGILPRLSTTAGLDGVGSADVVIEAVFEDVALKHRVIRETEAAMRPDAVFATNTSAIPIGRLVEASTRPQRFIGMHFFSPVEKMPLVEIITHPGTSRETIATTVALGVRLGKTPIVVADSPGFYTSRVFGRWLAEGLRLLVDGARVEQVDTAAKALGFPVGPLVAHDEVGLALVRKGGEDPVTAGITAGRVDRAPLEPIIRGLTDAGHEGKRNGRGFYAYGEDGRRRGAHPDLAALTGLPLSGDVADDVIADRLLWAFVSEALLCWDDGILRTPDDGDVGAVLGIGFPPNLGGPFHLVDQRGAAQAVTALERLGEPVFTVAPTLRKLAESGARYADL